MSNKQKVACLISEIQNIYILLKEKSRDADTSVTSSTIRSEDAEIRRMEIFVVIEYIRAAIEIILDHQPSQR